MSRACRVAITSVAVLLMLVACQAAPASPSTTVRVAAAADLRYALDELIAEWSTLHPQIVIEPVYGSSGNFYAQITQGAPFDLFFSADIEYPRALEDAGLAPAEASRTYALGRIVLWVRNESSLNVEQLGLAALADASVRRIAVANPEHAPYGRAAVEALRSADLLEALELRLVLGDNVAQAAQFVESGNADAGIIAISLALAPPLSDHGRYALIPSDSHPPIEQGALVLPSATDATAAREFLDFVLGEGQDVLERYGFLPAP